MVVLEDRAFSWVTLDGADYQSPVNAVPDLIEQGLGLGQKTSRPWSIQASRVCRWNKYFQHDIWHSIWYTWAHTASFYPTIRFWLQSQNSAHMASSGQKLPCRILMRS